MNTVMQDLRYGFRVLLKNPAFTIMSVLTLALGIGANTAIFSVVYGILLRPLPYTHGQKLVVLHQEASRANQNDIPFSVKEIEDYRTGNHTLDQVVEHHSMFFLLIGKDWAERVQTAVVSHNFFDVLGVKPLLGRTFVPSDETHGANAVLILSHKYWRGRNGGDPDIIGKVFQMNNRPHTVIGVLPPIPQYPVESDVYMPTTQCPFRSSPAAIANRQARLMTVFGRLKPGATVEQARADMATVAAQVQAANPGDYQMQDGYTVATAPLQSDLTERARLPFFVLLSASGLVLLIACANVANLLLARLLKIERELAVRLALGATRMRLARQLLTESVLLSLVGGLVGLAIAPAAIPVLTNFAGIFTTRAAEVHIDTPVLLFTLGIALLTGVLYGLAPAFTSGREVNQSMNQGTGRSTATAGRQRLRSALVVMQVAVSFMLLIGAGLMINSFLKMQSENPGFRPDHLLAVRLSANFSRYTTQPQLNTLRDEVLRAARNVAGVESAALTTNFPFSPSGIAANPNLAKFTIEGRPVNPGELAPSVNIAVVSANYFDTVKQPLVRGRRPNEHDDEKAPLVAVINQTMASHRWEKEDPIGRRVTFDNGKTWLTIVGIVGDVKEYGIDRKVGDRFYAPAEQNGFAPYLVLRTATQPMSMLTAVRAALKTIDPHLAVDNAGSVEDFEYKSMASPRVTAFLLGLFALLALVMSASGIAAVMALAVSQRTNELGIRMALGASRKQIIMMVVRHGLLLAISGCVLGVAGAIGLTRLLAKLLYGTSPTDFLTFAAVSALFVSVAAIACFIPARQVTSIDPLIALRQE
jgi:predicted permease